MSKIFFTSDLHIGHEKILVYTDRHKHWQNVHDMNEALVRNWNSVVGPKDQIYVLGDVCMGKLRDAMPYLKRLKGNKFLVKGNHDQKAVRDPEFRSLWGWIKDYYELKVYEPETGKKQLIVLCHYAFRVWNKSHHGSMALCGHSHGTLEEARPHFQGAGKLLDVGVDVHNYYPISYDHVKQIMLTKEVEKVDHHGER